jgi:hypothetical protein
MVQLVLYPGQLFMFIPIVSSAEMFADLIDGGLTAISMKEDQLRYIGDVGQNLWEEVDFQAFGTPGGLNFGWRGKAQTLQRFLNRRNYRQIGKGIHTILVYNVGQKKNKLESTQKEIEYLLKY